jgi:hypothetical protein
MLRLLMVTTLVAGTAAISAQSRNRDSFGQSAGEWCAESKGWNRNDRTVCDVREESLPGLSQLDVDTGGNGGIAVRGVPGSTVRLRLRLVAHARSQEDARRLSQEIDVSITDGRVRARGPRSRDGEGWSIDVEVETPRSLPLTLSTSNGGIQIEEVTGRTRFETSNGGVSLTDVAGDVRGSTVNGGVTVRLEGRQWEGAGLDVTTTNGGVRMSLPDGYSAELAAETTNGGLDIDFPITVQGGLTQINRRIVATLGSGGPRLHVRTVNGGVAIVRR